MPGLDPGIHAEVQRESHTSDNRRMDCRTKSGNEETARI
jgi:hypothetical protein